ncbi:MAG: hypothetical protein U1F52_16405 [Burkholderiales bacterium]
MTLARYKMDNYLKEIFLDSDTKMSLLSGTPLRRSSWWLLSNDAIQNACRSVNKMAGGTRMLGRHHHPEVPELDGRGRSRHRDPQARVLEVLHHR